ncbi:vitelline membrane outer layer protein 1-like [Eriocheir sinensis]|uniref:vitelline membrane outer layer protein 1-like n=1 Tax=Eriocheir sinensis TaxID=95602 RepID=UPI0021C90845|nr:vitelline membrane outer layer protein 1-like [Eriocheir sinensis]
MTDSPRLLLSLLLATSCCLLVFGSAPTPRRRITKTLYLSNGLPWGNWGDTEFCEDKSFAAYVEAKFEPYAALDADETALNALILYCVSLETGLPTGHIASTVGVKGELQGMKICTHGFITAIRARVLKSQGTFGDDVAIQNFQIECDRSYIINAVDGQRDSRIPLGEWGEWSACPDGSAICGMEIRYNKVDALTDDAATSDAVFYCCALNDTLTRTNHRDTDEAGQGPGIHLHLVDQ